MSIADRIRSMLIKDEPSEPDLKIGITPSINSLTAREKWLMEQAFKVGESRSYNTFTDWVDDRCDNDDYRLVEDLLFREAPK